MKLNLLTDVNMFLREMLLSKGKYQKAIGLIKDELGGQIMTDFAALRVKIDNNKEDKKAKGTKKSVVKKKLQFEDHKHCSEAFQLENKINHLEKQI